MSNRISGEGVAVAGGVVLIALAVGAALLIFVFPPLVPAKVPAQGTDPVSVLSILGPIVHSQGDKNFSQKVFIKDILLNKDGSVADYILSIGGFLGIGEKHVAVLPAQVELGNEEQRVKLKMTEAELLALPEVVEQ